MLLEYSLTIVSFCAIVRVSLAMSTVFGEELLGRGNEPNVSNSNSGATAAI